MTDPSPTRSPWAALTAICLGMSLVLLDMFVINVALPAIGRNFRAELPAMEWVVTIYALMLGVFPVAMGRLGDQFGRRRLYLAGLSLFTLASLACALAPTIGWLIAFRALQGLGGAIVLPLSLSLITMAFPPEKRGLAIGVFGGVSGLGLIAGPLLGGLLVIGEEWRWVFLINLPVGLAALMATRWLVAESRDDTSPRVIDWPGMLLLSGGLFLAVFGLTQARQAGWFSPAVLGWLGGGGALLALLALSQRRVRHPLIDPGLFRNVTFVAACGSMFLFSAAVFGTQPFMSLLMQNTWGFTPLQSGLGFLPATALVAVMLIVGGWLGQRLGRRLNWAIITGSFLIVVSALVLVVMTPASVYADSLLPAFLLRGLGIGVVISAGNLAAMSALPPAQAGLASGVITMARQVGTPWGIALLGSAYTTRVEAEFTAQPLLQSAGGTGELLNSALRFVPADGGPLREAAEAAIIAGFVHLAWVTAVLSAVAMAWAGWIRHRPPEQAHAPHATDAAAQPEFLRN